MKLINWDLLKHPYNWVVVFLMCSFFLIALSFVFPEAAAGD